MEAARAAGYRENPREAGAIDNWYTPYRQGWFGLMETLARFEKWDEILDGNTLAPYGKPREQAWRYWAMGLALAAKGDTHAAKGEAKAMDATMKELKAKTKDTPKPRLAARQELEGQIAFAAGKTDKSLQTLQSATRAERAWRYTEPPSYPWPVSEVLGRMALDKGKLRIAEDAFRQAIEQYPESDRALTGLSETLRRVVKPVPAGL